MAASEMENRTQLPSEIYRSSSHSNFTRENSRRSFSRFDDQIINYRTDANNDFLRKPETLVNRSSLMSESCFNCNAIILHPSSKEEKTPELGVFSTHSDGVCRCPRVPQFNCVSPRRPRPRPMPQPYYYEEIECEIEPPRYCEPDPCPPYPPCPPQAPARAPAPPRTSPPDSPPRIARRSYREIAKWTFIVLGYLLLFLALAVVMYSYFKVTTPPEEREFTNFLHFWEIT